MWEYVRQLVHVPIYIWLKGGSENFAHEASGVEPLRGSLPTWILSKGASYNINQETVSLSFDGIDVPWLPFDILIQANAVRGNSNENS